MANFLPIPTALLVAELIMGSLVTVRLFYVNWRLAHLDLDSQERGAFQEAERLVTSGMTALQLSAAFTLPIGIGGWLSRDVSPIFYLVSGVSLLFAVSRFWMGWNLLAGKRKKEAL